MMPIKGEKGNARAHARVPPSQHHHQVTISILSDEQFVGTNGIKFDYTQHMEFYVNWQESDCTQIHGAWLGPGRVCELSGKSNSWATNQ